MQNNYQQSQQRPQELQHLPMIKNLSLTRLFSEDDSPHRTLEQEEVENFDWQPKAVFKNLSAPVISPPRINFSSAFAAPIETKQVSNEGDNDKSDSSLEFLNAFGEEVSMSPLSQGHNSLKHASSSPLTC